MSLVEVLGPQDRSNSPIGVSPQGQVSDRSPQSSVRYTCAYLAFVVLKPYKSKDANKSASGPNVRIYL